MKAGSLLAVSLALGACGSPDTGSDAGEGDFASRIGAGAATATAVGADAGAAVPSVAVKGPPPPAADVFSLEKLGDIGAVDLGPRAGGCTFVVNGTETLIAAAPADRALPGKGVVRIGGRLIALDTPPGGIAAVRAGTSFRGEGFNVAVRPTGPGKATMTITNAAGQTRATAGDYICA